MAVMNNPYIIMRGNVKYLRAEGNRPEMPARAFSKWLELAICKYKRWIYNGGTKDGGIDALTPAGRKKIQLKSYVEYNQSSFNLGVRFDTQEEAEEYGKIHQEEDCRAYAEKFNTLVLYAAKFRGEAFNPKNLQEINKHEDIVAWLIEHSRPSYQNDRGRYLVQYKLKWEF